MNGVSGLIIPGGRNQKFSRPKIYKCITEGEGGGGAEVTAPQNFNVTHKTLKI